MGVIQARSYRGAATQPRHIGDQRLDAARHPRSRRAAGRRHLRHRPHAGGAARADSTLGPRSRALGGAVAQEGRQEVAIRPDHVAFEIPDVFVVGYGLDYQDAYRNLPYRGDARSRRRSGRGSRGMTRRILQIIPTLTAAGPKSNWRCWPRGLPRDEFDVHVCALTHGGPLEPTCSGRTVPVTVIGKRWKFDPIGLVAAAAAHRAPQPDLVQTWMFTANAYGRTAALSAGVPQIVASERCVDSWKTSASTGHRPPPGQAHRRDRRQQPRGRRVLRAAGHCRPRSCA